MTNNDILRRIRYTFDLKDSTVVEIFAAADHATTKADISHWLQREGDADYRAMTDAELAAFLNGFINTRRGKREGAQPPAEKRLTNNMIFMKLRIALNMKAEVILEILQDADFYLSKHELSAFFRKVGHKHYRECKDQVLRNFLTGLQQKFRPS